MKDIELGTLLRKARQEKNLTLADIQEKTKIRKKYLEAIEENNFDLLPGQVYLKVFVKGYAREVDINYQELLKYYSVLNIKEEQESKLHKDYLNGTTVPHRKNKKVGSKNKFVKIILIALLSLFLIAAGIYAYQYFNSSQIRTLNQSNIENEADLETHSEIVTPENNAVQDLNNTNNNNDFTDNSNNNSNQQNYLLNNDLEAAADNSVDSVLLSSQAEKLIDQNILDSLEADSLIDDAEKTEIIISEDLLVNNESSELILDNTNDQEINEEEINNQQIDLQEINDQEANNNSANISNSENEETLVNQVTRTVKFLADDTVWINVIVNDETLFTGILEAEESRKFDFNNKLYIKIGKAKAVKALIDGQEYGPWSGRGEVAEIEMSLSNNELEINNLRN